MKHPHLHLKADNIDQSIKHHTASCGGERNKVKGDYAKSNTLWRRGPQSSLWDLSQSYDRSKMFGHAPSRDKATNYNNPS